MTSAEKSQNTLPPNIGIVTAFFDIGRGEWSQVRDLPEHIHRTTDTYFERFAHLASLENEMVIFTSPDLAPRVQELRRGKEDRTAIIPVPIKDMFPEQREAIRRVQNDPAYKAMINAAQADNPEYWSVDYILVTNLKAVLTANAIQNNWVKAPQVAWVDFGYCRDASALGGSKKWEYDFTPGQVHFFVFSKYNGEVSIQDIIANNIVYVAGAAVVAERHLWKEFSQLTLRATDELMKRNLVDDDQTMFLLASLYKPELFEQHLIPDQQWQPVLRMFNKNAVKA